MALSLRVAFFGLLHTGELLRLKAKDIFLPSPKGSVALSLGLTKAGAPIKDHLTGCWYKGGGPPRKLPEST